MRLKYLTLCVLGLSISGCAQHVIKTNSGSTHLEQKAINSINAMYEYPSYDYRGKFNVHVDLDANQAVAKPDQVSLNPALQQKVDQYLQAQKVQLDAKQKQALYTAIAQQPQRDAAAKSDKFMQIFANILNDMQFEYDGSVHYRQKIGSFNLTARYEKPTLLVQAKVPMVLDLNNYKFYINYFALMPYLVNKDNQNNLAYLDFSKYQNLVKQIDYKKFVEYVKASGAVYYRLADQNNIQALSLSSADRAAGVVEKIRLSTSIEEVLLQATLYGKVNEKYLTQQILNFNEKNLEKLISSEMSATPSKTGTAVSLSEESANDARVASQQLYRLVNQHFGVENEETDSAISATAAKKTAGVEQDEDDAAQSNAADSDSALANDEQTGLTEAQCLALQQTTMIRYGDLQYCQSTYEIDLFSQTPKAEIGSQLQKNSALEKIFSAYNQNQFIDDHAFKALWLKHQTDIQATLPPASQRNPFIMDVGLDAQGRAIKLDYDLDYALPQFKSRFNVKADMQILNYGKATPIDQEQLKRAKTWTDASKGSMLEQAIGSFSKKLGQSDIVVRPAQSSGLTLDEQLKHIAAQRYDTTHSYEQTYKAVFIAKMIEHTPQVVQHYSNQELQEIASVYTYWYADEAEYNPQGKALANIETLQKKHHLEQEDQFDDKLGQAVRRIVNEAIHGEQDRQAWKKLQAQYKQPQQLFAKQYQIQFERENGASNEEKMLLEQTANILGQAYVDARKNQLSEESIKALKSEQNEFIDYEIFQDIYQKMLNSK